MPIGERTIHPNDIPDCELLDLLPLIDALSHPETRIEPHSPASQLTAVNIARVAECAVEQYSKDLRQGSVTDYRRRARQIVESAFAETMYISGQWDALMSLTHKGRVSKHEFVENTRWLRERSLEIARLAASHTATLLRSIKERRERVGRKGRPRGAGTVDALFRMQDSAVLNYAAMTVGPSKASDEEAILSAIPTAVREAIRLGQLTRPMGDEFEEEQLIVDRHVKRIRSLFFSIKARHIAGGSSN